MTATKKFYLAYSKATNAALHLMKNTGESVTDLLDLNEEESVCVAKEQIEQGSVDAIILVINKNILTVPTLVPVLTVALEKEVSIVLILPDGALLPSAAAISSLDSSIQTVFRQTPIPFIADFSKHCWKKIFERINRMKQEPPKVNWFICCNPKNSIGFTLSKELAELEETSFVNYKDDHDTSYCRKSIESADYFALVVSKDLFTSSNCRKELIWAIRHNKPIAIIKDKAFKLKDSIPTEWRDFTSLLNGPITLVYTPFYASECAIELVSFTKEKRRIITSDSKNYPVAKKQWKHLDALNKNPSSSAFSDLARCLNDTETIELDDGQVMTKQQLSLIALKLDFNNSYAFCTLGDTLRSDDTFELPDGARLDKRGCFLKAIQLDGNNELAYCDLADSLGENETVKINENEEKTAIDLYLISIKINPHFATAYNNLACQMPKKTTVTLLDGEVVTDKELFLRSLKSDSSDPLVFQNLGVALSKGEKITLPDGRVVTKKELQEWK